jgi:phosphoserine phosphatase RsbU/P
MNQKKILVVDDMLVNREWAGRILRTARYAVEYASDGHQALELLHTPNKYDLVLLDVEMPGINGFEVCREMRNDDKLQEIPVIFLTSQAKIENKVFGFRSGAQDYVTKPFSPKELLVRINTHLQLKHKSDIIKDMNDTLVEKNKNITDSITYAQYIQKALLPSYEILNTLTSDYFIFNKPKDILSGDFYWIKQCGDTLYFAVADCTGHGVPGAIMSVLGLSMLNEIAREYCFYPPNLILNELRKKIISSLHQEGNSLENKDGMDIGICMLNLDSLTLEYAGAHVPLFVLRKNIVNGNFELIKRSPDRMPVGKHPNENTGFSNHSLDLQEDDRIFLFSDGYISQFGGEFNKTYKLNKFLDLLVRIQNHSLPEQATILEEEITHWRGANEQADDMLVFGLKVKKMKH